MALGLLRCGRQRPALLGPWRGQVKGRLTPRMAPLTALMPLGSRGVDLCMLTSAAPTFEQGVQALMAIPAEHVMAEQEYTDRMYKLPAGAWAVAEADGPARYQLVAATRAAYQALIEPYWPRIHACLHAEQIARAKVLATGGPDRVLTSLRGRLIRWRRPVLEVLVPGHAEVHLDGRGIVLVPSVFVGETPSLHQNPNDAMAAPWLVLPRPTTWSAPGGCGMIPGRAEWRWPLWWAGTGPRC